MLAVIAATLQSIGLLGWPGARGNPTPVSTLILRAQQAANNDDWNTCVESYTAAFEKQPSNLTVLRGRSACETSTGDYKNAENDLTRVIATEDGEASDFLHRAGVEALLGNGSSALSDYRHVTQMVAVSPDDVARAIEGLRAARLPEIALSTAVAATQRYPQAWQMHDELALVYTDLGDPARAAAEFDQAVALSPQNGRAMVLIDRAQFEKTSGNLQAAFADANAAVGLAARWESLRARGEVRWAMGDLPGAENDFSQALAVAQSTWWPDAKTVWIWLLDDRGRVRLAMGAKAEAASDFRAALALTVPNDLATRRVLQNEFKEARS